MGEEEASSTPFQFFTDYSGDLATAVRDGRRREFTGFEDFDGEGIPDPNATATFDISRFRARPEAEDFHRKLLQLRHTLIVPRLPGTRPIEAAAIGPAAVRASWRMGDGAVLTILVNLGHDPCETNLPHGSPIFATHGAIVPGMLPGFSTLAFIDAPS